MVVGRFGKVNEGDGNCYLGLIWCWLVGYGVLFVL